MRVLVITDTDSVNNYLAPICKKLRNRGHILSLYGSILDNPSIREFTAIGLSVAHIDKLNDNIISNSDIMLCGKNYPRKVLFSNIYIFQYDFTYDWFIQSAADFTFFLFSEEIPRLQLRHAKMSIGNTMRDNFGGADSNIGERKQILYIDSGHMPYGYEGKAQIADMLLQVCRENPDYELVIKPRWLRGNSGFMTHRNTMHIYDVIEERCNGKLPENLTMLNEHMVMNDLIRISHCVITLQTMAIVDVLLHGKGLCIIDDFVREDKFDMRLNTHVAAQIDYLARSGCSVHLSDVSKHMPHGIKSDGEFLREILPSVADSCAKAVDVMEFTFDSFIKKGKYPDTRKYSCNSYVDEMADSQLTFDEVKQIRLGNQAQKLTLQVQDFLSVSLDFTELHDFIQNHYVYYPFTPNGRDEFIRECNLLKFKILRANRNLLMRDPIDQDFLLRALYDTGYDDEIINMHPKEIIADGPHHFYAARILQQCGETEAAVEHYIAFLEDVNSRCFDKYLTELTDYGFKIAYTELFKLYDGVNVAPRKMCELISSMHESKRNHLLPDDLHGKVYKKLYSTEGKELIDEDGKALYQTGKCVTLYYEKEFNRLMKDVGRLKKEILEENSGIQRENERVQKEYECVLKENERNRKENIRLKKENERIKKETVGKQNEIKRLHSIISRHRRKKNSILHMACSALQFIRTHGLRYSVRFVFKEKLFLRLSNLLKVPMQLRRNFCDGVWKGYISYSRVMREFGENARLYLASNGTGDTYLMGAKFNALCKRQPFEQVPVYVVNQSGGGKIAQLFGIRHIFIFGLDEMMNLYRLLMFGNDTMRLHSLFSHVFTRHTGVLRRLYGFKGATFHGLETYFAYGDIPDNEAQRPVFNSDGVDEIFEKHELVSKKVIMLSPYAKSVKQIPENFWIRIAKNLSDIGYMACTNCAIDRFGNPEGAIQGTIGVFVPYDKLVPFLEKTNGLIALRSGMQDVSESADCLNISLQLKQGKFNAYYGSLNDVYSMENYYAKPNMYDMLYTPRTEPMLIDKIVNMVVEYTKNKEKKFETL